jgi:hypothetical protein
MTQQSSSFGPEQTLPEQATGVATATVNKTVEVASEALDRADQWLRPIGLSVKERPMTCLAVVGGIAFAAGALWMLRPTRPQSRLSDFASQLADYKRRW